MKRARSGRGGNDLRRHAPRMLATGKSFLIVTEGLKTEPYYLNRLSNRLKLASADVEVVHPQGTDPLTLTQEAIRRKDARAREAKKSEILVAYDEVWVVFDLERIHDERRQIALQAYEVGGAQGIKFAESDPAFEFWLLLHSEYTTAPMLSAHEAISRLRIHWPEYSKVASISEDLLDKTPIACGRARQCRQHHADCRGDGNPSTSVDLLVYEMNAAAREGARFDLPNPNPEC